MTALKNRPDFGPPKLNRLVNLARKIGLLAADNLLPEHCPLCEIALDPSLDQVLLCRFCQSINDLSKIDPNVSCVRCALPLLEASPGKSPPNHSRLAPQAHDIESAVVFCPDCLSRPPSFRRSIICSRYGSIPAIMIHTLKVKKTFYAARFIAHEMAITVAEQNNPQGNSQAPPLGYIDALLPVPLHPRRQKSRGFNQANEIAKLLGKHFALPVLDRAATRIVETPAQKGLNRRERQKALRGAFSVDTEEVVGKRIAIVDDVVTTTSTVRELAKTLLQAGCADCEVWAYARTPAPET